MKSSTTKRIVAGLLAAAMPLFTNAEPGPSSTTRVASDIVIEQQWQIDSGVSQPESVLVIADHDWLYVSNVNGEEKAGFISKVSKEGHVESLKWIDGIQTPTGMGYFAGLLYVADQNQVHVIDVSLGKVVKSLSSKAISLNDIAVTEDGRVFITDLTSGSLYTIQDNEVVHWLSSPLFTNLNGILIQGDKIWVGSVGTRLALDLKPDELGSIYEISISEKSVSMVEGTENIALVDGLQAFEQGYIVPSPASGTVYYFDEQTRTAVGMVDIGVADIAIDQQTNMLYAPILFGDKLNAYRIYKK
ncbi:hypothetical protein QWZ04_21025 [Vibrio tapetis subsp. quintayensis]|uniref:hypothetical protein n=1 Tax=Vibrio tapetis TaxID=52443 RepID=UPI0025B61F1A|nr:hypothetical protein [Vibrio tapetis]MDN3682791.1 hypothetical protein [Vibrio tapetis subsp. quintayensis]